MTYDELLTVVGIDQPPAEWRDAWDRAMATYPADGLSFLTEDFLAEMQGVCGFAEDALQAVRDVSAAVRQDAALARLAWLWHVLLFRTTPEVSSRNWPFPASLGELAEMFPAVVFLSGLPDMLALHRQRGVPAQVTRDTCADLDVWMRHARQYTGRWGFTRLDWLMNHCLGRLYRVGRLQFYYNNAYGGGVHVFRQRETGEVRALSAPGITYRRDGLVDGTNGRTDPAAWQATLTIDKTHVTGYPVHPDGWVECTPVALPLHEWAQVLRPGDPVLDLHIPADGKMDHAACGAALWQGLAFYARHFPELPPPRAFVCSSWLLDTQYQRLLSPESNIVRFQREFYCYPVLSDDLDPFFRVFGGKPTDLHAAPRDTTLQRAMLDFTLAGNALRAAAGFILVDGLQWGR